MCCALCVVCGVLCAVYCDLFVVFRFMLDVCSSSSTVCNVSVCLFVRLPVELDGCVFMLCCACACV